MSKNVSNKSLDEIAKEWNCISVKRHKIIEIGKDVSLSYVTGPCIIRNLSFKKLANILDVGCGTGYLTNEISNLCDVCYGIDASDESIKLARKTYQKEKIKFINTSIANFNTNVKFDACVSNMVIMTDPEWKVSLKHIWGLLKPNGMLLIMLAHPCFWPLYWGYSDKEWFDYNQEIYIQDDFRTSFSGKIGVSTHIHRSISSYLNTIVELGFQVVGLEEPTPISETPQDYVYDYPRFLLIKCKKS